MIKKKKKIGIIGQVAILFAISILASGFLTFYTQHVVSDAFVKSRTENLADQAADEVRLSVMEYPAHDWLLRYWYEHFDELEIEYDTDYEQSTVTREMDDYTRQIAVISAEEERIGTELALAARIQEAMLPMTFPPFPDREEFEIYASMDPAKEVGGDFYDFFFIDDDHLCLVIADVSGKGVPAAMFMTISKIILANTAILGKSPAETLENANTAICPNNREEMFVTVWMGILELSTGILTASNAGHEYPILKKPNGKFELLKDRHGFVIGGMEGMKYRSYELRIEPGSTIFLYTDGLPEATDAEKCMFGIDRILTVLNKNPDQNPEQILRTMTEAVNDFVKDAEQFDDLTMLCLSYKGPLQGRWKY